MPTFAFIATSMASSLNKLGEATQPPVKLLDQVRARVRNTHYSIRTERTYVEGVRLSGVFLFPGAAVERRG